MLADRRKCAQGGVGIFLQSLLLLSSKAQTKKKALENREPLSMQIRKLLSAKNERCDSWMFSNLYHICLGFRAKMRSA
jgi:hypothetical protein